MGSAGIIVAFLDLERRWALHDCGYDERNAKLLKARYFGAVPMEALFRVNDTVEGGA